MSTLKASFTAVFCLLFTFGCTNKSSAPAKEVNLAIWGNYLAPELITKFTQDTGIKLNISNYASNEELLAKIQAGSSGIDVAVPSDYMVRILTKLQLLAPLDKKQIPNQSLLSSDFLAQKFDPTNDFSLPYSWTTTGIAIRRDLFKGKIKSWKDVFSTAELKGRISFLDDVREVTSTALKMNGFSVNSKDPKELEKAKKTLLELKPKIKMFRSDMVDALVAKEVVVAQVYSPDALIANKRTGGQVEYVLPAEGGTLAMDNLVILKSSRHIDLAHKLINFMLSPETNLSFVKNVMGGPVLKVTKEKLPPELQANLSLFPDKASLVKFEMIEDLGDATKLYDDLWTAVKSE